MKAYIFAGQGSQRKGMGKDLFASYPQWVSQANEILGYSIEELCIQNPDEKLKQTEYTQPALYVVNALAYMKLIEEHGKPDFLAGHSLGEYNALLASAAFDFTTGLKLVQKRGALMGLASGGAMAAVIGFHIEQVREVLQTHGFDRVDIANLNTPTQTVISGLQEDLDRAKPIFEAAGVRMFTSLKVSAAFHSRYMEPARAEFESFLAGFTFGELQIPVLSNKQVRPYRNDQIKMLLADQITHPVRWVESILYLQGKGVEEFKEVGRSKVLTKLVRLIKTESEPLLTSLQTERSGSKVPGSEAFKSDYQLKYAYVAGGMYGGISSADLVVAMARAGMLAYFGSGGLDLALIETAITKIQEQLGPKPFGVNFLKSSPQLERNTVELLLKRGVCWMEAAGFLQMSVALVWFRLKGIHRNAAGEVVAPNRIMCKVTRPEVARGWMSPAPPALVEELRAAGLLNAAEVQLAQAVPMSGDVCVVADAAWQSEAGMPYTLMPAMLRLRDELSTVHTYKQPIRVGAAGGIGTPEAVLAAWMLGADFIQTGSINQCCVEADTSEVVKDLLEQVNVQDTTHAPAAEGFEIGVQVQVLKRGLFFPARANKLYELYRRYGALGEIDEKTAKQLQDRYLLCSFEDAYQQACSHFRRSDPEMVKRAESQEKARLAMVFRWYLVRGLTLARETDGRHKVDYQIFCGPAMGAFNQWVKGTTQESWRKRHVAQIGQKLMEEASALLEQRMRTLLKDQTP